MDKYKWALQIDEPLSGIEPLTYALRKHYFIYNATIQ